MKRRIKGLVNAILGIFFGGVITSCFPTPSPAPAYMAPCPMHETNSLNFSGDLIDSESLRAVQAVRIKLLADVKANGINSGMNISATNLEIKLTKGK